jgi:hypothetical protein
MDDHESGSQQPCNAMKTHPGVKDDLQPLSPMAGDKLQHNQR